MSINRKKSQYPHRKPELVYRQGDRATVCYRVTRGLVWLVRTTARGDQMLVEQVLPGDFFGHEALLGNEEKFRNEAVQIIPGTLVEKVSTESFTVPLRRALFKNLMQRNLAGQWTMSIRSLPYLADRVLAFFVFLAKNGLGATKGEMVAVFCPRHQEIALALSACRESVSLALRELRCAKRIVKQGRAQVLIPIEIVKKT